MPRRPKAATRRARGTGSIFFNAKKGRWVGRVPVGKKATGKTVYRECWGRTQAEVVTKMAAARPPGPDTTVAQWAARWLATLTSREQTVRGYADRLEHVLPVLGHLRVADVTAADVERLAATLVKELARSTTAVVLGVAGSMFRAAVRARLIATNPVADARRPKVPRRRQEVYGPADLARVIESADWYAGAGAAALMAAVGCRVGEAVALDVTDFDPAAGTVRITKTFVATLNRVGPPKSENGVRTIRVPAVALPVLRAAAGGRTTGPLFRTGKGKRLRQSTIDRGVRLVLAGLGLTPRGSHSLRHSVASALVAAGVPVADVARYLGDSVDTIVRTYVHATGADPAAALDRLYGGRKVGGGGRTGPAAPETA
jgi:integrase